MIQSAIRGGLEFLARWQLPDGGFASFSSPADAKFIEQAGYSTVFLPATMLDVLSDVDTPLALEIREGLVGFLQAQRSEQGSFNYWDRRSKEYRLQPYPDDLDDTFCALKAMVRHRPDLVGGGLLADAAQLLIATEEKPGGPYRTWLTAQTGAAWRDVDVAVNANIAGFLALVGVELSSLVELVEQAIVAPDGLSSPYYPTVYP
jgi:hypothetical protein